MLLQNRPYLRQWHARIMARSDEYNANFVKTLKPLKIFNAWKKQHKEAREEREQEENENLRRRDMEEEIELLNINLRSANRMNNFYMMSTIFFFQILFAFIVFYIVKSKN